MDHQSFATGCHRGGVNGDQARKLRSPRPPSAWTVEDSLELFQVPAWGKGYFSINAAGHVVVRPDTTADREIDLHEVVQGLSERDLRTPVVVRFSDILAHRLQAPARRVRAGHCRERLPQPLCRGVSHQGQPAAPGGRRGVSLRQGIRLRPGGGIQARTAGRDGDDRGFARPADRLQRLQGLQLHRGGDPGHQAGPHHHSGGRELRRAGPDPAARRQPTACGRGSACA